MARLRHERQRRFHEFRYGLRHLLRHRRGEAHAHKRRKLTKVEKSNRKMFRVGLILVGVGALFLVALILVAAIRVNSARSSLEAARASLVSLDQHQSELLTSSGRTQALTQLGRAADQSARASRVFEDSRTLSVISKVPFLGAQIQGVQHLANDVHSASEQGIDLITSVNQLDHASAGATISLSELSLFQQTVERAANSLVLLETSSGGLVGPVGSARTEFNARLSRVVGQLDKGNQILTYLSTFLGAHGPRTYLLATENQAEMRDQGSVLSVGQIHAANGHVSVDSPVSVGQYKLSQPVDYPVPLGTAKVFGIDQPTLLWQNANVTADFPWSGGDLAAMYAQATGVADDGVVAVDVHALAGLLSLSGPVTVPEIPVPVSSQNAESLLLDTLYQQNPIGSQSVRQDALAAVTTAAINQLFSSHVDLAAFAHVLANEVAGRHLLIYDAQPNLEAILRQYGASGAVDSSDPTRTFHFAIENATATKLDYFISTSVHQRVILTPRGDADVLTSVTVTNHAPANQPPSYQLGPDGFSSHVPGEYVGIAYLWGPRGSLQAAGVSESGLEVSSANLDLLPGKSETVQFVLVIPHAANKGTLTLRWVPQPTVQPQRVAIFVRTLNGSAVGEPKRKIVLESPQNFSWNIPS